jgi:hypothetical protein
MFTVLTIQICYSLCSLMLRNWKSTVIQARRNRQSTFLLSCSYVSLIMFDPIGCTGLSAERSRTALILRLWVQTLFGTRIFFNNTSILHPFVLNNYKIISKLNFTLNDHWQNFKYNYYLLKRTTIRFDLKGHDDPRQSSIANCHLTIQWQSFSWWPTRSEDVVFKKIYINYFLSCAACHLKEIKCHCLYVFLSCISTDLPTG